MQSLPPPPPPPLSPLPLSPVSPLLRLTSLEIKPSEVKLECELGRGSFGVVYRGEWRGQSVAVKKLHLSTADASVMRDFEREVRILSLIRSPRLIQVLGFSLETSDPFIVTELMERGSLFECMHGSDESKRPPRDAAQLWRMSLHLAEGVSYMHACEPPLLQSVTTHTAMPADCLLYESG